MGIEMPAEYYDEKIPQALEDGWVRLYNLVAGILRAYHPDVPILDLGCGHGRLAAYLYMYGFTDYTGVDFSGKCIDIARSMNTNYKFIHSDIFTDEVMEMIKNYHVIILTEVLEHIENDLEILLSIPKGAIVIISVPNSNDEAHVRSFPQPEKMINRYGRFIELDFIGSIMANDKGKIFHICSGRRK